MLKPYVEPRGLGEIVDKGVVLDTPAKVNLVDIELLKLAVENRVKSATVEDYNKYKAEVEAGQSFYQRNKTAVNVVGVIIGAGAIGYVLKKFL